MNSKNRKITFSRIVVESINYSSKSTDAISKNLLSTFCTLKIRRESWIFTSLCGRFFSFSNNWLKNNERNTEWKLGPSTWIIRMSSKLWSEFIEAKTFLLIKFMRIGNGLGIKIKRLFTQTNADSISCWLRTFVYFIHFSMENSFHGLRCIIFHSLCLCWLWTAKRVTNVCLPWLPSSVSVCECYHINGMERIVINLWCTLKQIKGFINQIKC